MNVVKSSRNHTRAVRATLRNAVLAAAISAALAPLSARAQDAGLAAVVDQKFGNAFLFAQTSNGLEILSSSSLFHHWWSWQPMPNTTGVPQSQWDKNLVGFVWQNPIDLSGFYHMNAFFAFDDPFQNAAIRIQHHVSSGISSIIDPNAGYTLGGVSLRNANFAPMFPKTGYAFGTTFRLWGTDAASSARFVPSGLPAQPSRIRMRSFDPFTGVHINQDLGPVPGFAPEVIMGPEASAHWDLTGASSVQLLAVAQSDKQSQVFSIQCFLQEANNPLFKWVSLRFPGNPNRTSGRARAPLTVAYNRFGEARIRVFVVAMDDVITNGEKRWKLYSIERTQSGKFVNDKGEAGLWNDHGVCPDMPLQKPGDEPTPVDGNGVPQGFGLNSRIVWNDSLGNQRVNLFGATDNGRFLVEFFFNGSTWQWGLQPHTTPPGEMIKAVANGINAVDGKEFRLSVFARMTDDTIWEHFFDTVQGSQWKWLRLR